MTTSRHPSTLVVLLLLVTACSGEGPGPAPAASSAPATAASSAPRPTSTASAASTATAAKTAKAKATPAERATLVKHLTEGRKLSKKKEFKQAVAELDKALAIAPKDPRVLAEVGWAAFNAGDLERAADANQKALSSTSEPMLRAQILYNAGRVAEEKKDNDAARRAYGDSLALRDNAEVKKRFEGVGGKPDQIVPVWATCSEGFASAADLCACLVKHADDVIMVDGKASCDIAKDAPDLGDPRLSIARLKNELGSADAALLVAKDGNKFRAVAHLGEDFEPGAFGVHNEVELKGGEIKTVKGRQIAIVKSIQSNVDFNLAGLEVCTFKAESHTVCVLGDDKSPTVCPRIVPVSSEGGCGIGVELDPKDIDAETKALMDEIKANAKPTKTKLSYTIDDDGKLSVKIVDGDASMFPPAALGELLLLPSSK